MDELDSRVYDGFKESIRKAVKNISEDNLKWGKMPIVLVDFHSWSVHYFEDEYQTKEHLERKYSSWDDEPPNGEDNDLVLFKFCTEKEKTEFEHHYRKYKLYKEVNDKKIYREMSFVEFEPELIINVCI